MIDIPPKASITFETPPKASIVPDNPSKLSQEASSPCIHVVTPEPMPEPPTPFSSFLLSCASKAAAQITSLLQPSPSPQTEVMAFVDEEEHTIVFDEAVFTPSTLAPSVPSMTTLEMDSLPHPDDEVIIVFETEMVTPVCLFPEAPSTAASVTNPVCNRDCGLESDVAPRVLVDGESDNDNGQDVLIDATNSLDTFHDSQMFLHHAYTIMLATLQGHYNTMHLLPPANGHLSGLVSHLANSIVHWLPSNDQSWKGYAPSPVLTQLARQATRFWKATQCQEEDLE
jgi:hypothetical protein